MFPDFNEMQRQAADAMKRAEERHREHMLVQFEILRELRNAGPRPAPPLAGTLAQLDKKYTAA